VHHPAGRNVPAAPAGAQGAQAPVGFFKKEKIIFVKKAHLLDGFGAHQNAGTDQGINLKGLIDGAAFAGESPRAQQPQQAFIAQCKNILTADEINTIFGSVTALETGATQTEAPAVLGDTDEVELGFKIENQETSIENVTEKIDKNAVSVQRLKRLPSILKKLQRVWSQLSSFYTSGPRGCSHYRP